MAHLQIYTHLFRHFSNNSPSLLSPYLGSGNVFRALPGVSCVVFTTLLGELLWDSFRSFGVRGD